MANAMNDSPAGLASWLVEKRRTWSHSNGDVESRFSKDELCTIATLYWVTESYGTSARYYYECMHNRWKPSHDRQPVVEAPTALADFKHDVAALPRKWSERFHNLKQYSTFDVGGHFAPMEEPELLVEDIRKFFRTL
jgi:pimeloyl-ACP methyl ester carboxylesterase